MPDDGITVATGVDLTMGRDHRPPAAPARPPPKRFHSQESAGVLGPLRGDVRGYGPCPGALRDRVAMDGRLRAVL